MMCEEHRELYAEIFGGKKVGILLMNYNQIDDEDVRECYRDEFARTRLLVLGMMYSHAMGTMLFCECDDFEPWDGEEEMRVYRLDVGKDRVTDEKCKSFGFIDQNFDRWWEVMQHGHEPGTA